MASEAAPPLPVRQPTITRKPVPEKSPPPVVEYERPFNPAQKELAIYTDTALTDQAYELTLDDIDVDSKDDSPHDEYLKSPTELDSPSSDMADDLSIKSPTQSKWKIAFDATKHFAGGLVSHPVESTRHYSILRHSHGIVIYKGMSTNIAITIFADEDLPPERTIWLQQKGWTGTRGMRVKNALGRTDKWIEVTPQARVTAAQINASDEKAWQRDIGKFLRKAAEAKKFKRRRVVETCIIRIPYMSQDGYFRLVVCADEGKELLCASPVFRVASLSASSASFKGASLSTMPFEIGIKALTMVASDMASAGMAPVAGAIQNRFGQFMPGFVTHKATRAAYAATGLQGKLDGASERYQQERAGGLEELTGDERPIVVGDDGGPEEPYPVRFSGKVVHGEGKSNVETGLPTANLSGVRAELKSRLNGVYFGWAAITQSKTIVSDEWRQVLIFARPPEGAPGITLKKVIRAYIIEDFAGVEFFDAKLTVMVMGFLRPWNEYDPAEFAQETYIDIMIAQQSLEREHWGPTKTLQRVATETTQTDRYVNVLQFGQRQIDRIPFDKLAVRRPNVGLKDGVMGKGGLFIDRTADLVHVATAPRP